MSDALVVKTLIFKNTYKNSLLLRLMINLSGLYKNKHIHDTDLKRNHNKNIHMIDRSDTRQEQTILMPKTKKISFIINPEIKKKYYE